MNRLNKMVIVMFFSGLIIVSCQVYTVVYRSPSYGKFKVRINGEEFVEDNRSASMDIDSSINKSRLLIGAFLTKDSVVWHNIRFPIIYNYITTSPKTGVYNFEPTIKIYYHIIDTISYPYYAHSGYLNITKFDSLGPYNMSISGNFDFKVIRKKIRDTIHLEGRFDTIRYNFLYTKFDM